MPTFALAIWPIITLFIFANMPRKQAVLTSILSGYLLLPQRFSIDLPGLPPFEKNSVIMFCMLLGLVLFRGRDTRTPDRSSGLTNGNAAFGVLIIGLAVLYTVNVLLTVQTNGEPIRYASIRAGGPVVVLPALSFRDTISMLVDVVILVAPYFVARKLFTRPEGHQLLLRFVVIAGLLYSLLMLFEARFSPQLHNWVYGYHQHSFAQHVRGGQFRPKVFLQHGLWVGMFTLMSVICAAALIFRKDQTKRLKAALVCAYLVGVLIISHNTAATLLAILTIPLFLLGRKLQLTAVVAVASVFLLYPAVRQADILPLERITEVAAAYSPARAQSFQFRLDNETILLDRAAGKPFSGWGGWNRSRVFNEFAEDISVTDGLWVIVLGVSGWLGYIGFFGLLVAPLLMLRSVRKRKEIPVETIGIALVLTCNLIYLVPNSALNPVGWFMAGALAGFVQFDAKRKKPEDVSDQTEPSPSQPSYTRFPVADGSPQLSRVRTP